MVLLVIRLLSGIGLAIRVGLGLPAGVSSTPPHTPIDRSSFVVSSPECAPNPFLGGELDITGYPHLSATVEDVATGCRYTIGETDGFPMASSVKAEILGAVLLRLQDDPTESPSESLDWLLRSMITESDNDAADQLLAWLGGADELQVLGERLGLNETDNLEDGWGDDITTPTDQLRLLRALTIGGGALSQDSVDFARSLMMSVDPEQAWGISNGIPDDSTVMLKNGWYDLGDYDGNVVWRVNSEGLIELPTGRRYLLAVFSDGWTNQQAGVDAIEAISATVAAAWH